MLAMFRFALPVLALLFLARSSAPAASLFLDIEPSYGLSDPSVLSGSDRERLVRINTRALVQGKAGTARSIDLNLFHDKKLLTQLHSAEYSKDMFRWRGTIEGDPAGYAVLIMQDAQLVGRIHAFHKEYEVIPSENGLHRIREVKRRELPFDPFALIPAGLQKKTNAAARARKSTPVVQIIIVYSKKAVEKTVISARRYAQLAIDEINMILRNSRANAVVDLAGVFVLDYEELGYIFQDLERFRNPNDGVWDEVHRFRDQKKADIATLVVSYQHSFGGAASQLYDLSLDFAAYAFNIVRIQLIGFHVPTLAHEIGHNLGSTHDRCENGDGIFDYSYAFENFEQGWTTIMSNGTCLFDARMSYFRLPLFSNRAVKYNGIRVGTGLRASDPANNAASLFHGASLGSQWRQNCRKSSKSPTLVAPEHETENVAADKALQWKTRGWPWVELQLSTSPAFRKYRSYIAFSTRLFVPLENGTTYYWRVRGLNDCEESSFTETRSFTTD